MPTASKTSQIRPNAQQFGKLFSRAATAPDCPEKNLILAVIQMAVLDAIGTSSRKKGKVSNGPGLRSGQNFFT